MNNYRVGLALSGGGARGVAHAGVLQALDELNIPVNVIAGTSSGAMVGLLYAAGVKPIQMAEMIIRSKLFDISGISFSLKGLLRSDIFRKIIKQHVKATRFEELSIPLMVFTTDFNNAKPVIFTEGPFMEPVVASCSIPLIFPPVKYHGTNLVDGGLLNNFPADLLYEKCHGLIGVNVNPIGTLRNKKISSVIERCFQMAIGANNSGKSKLCSVFIEPAALTQFSVFDTKNAYRIFDIGYQETKNRADELLSLLK